MELEDVIDSIEGLPPVPQVLPKLQKLLDDEDVILLDILSLIKLDTPLTTQIIKMSNSSYFALSTPCDSLEEAVNRIGFQEVYQLVCILTLKTVIINDATLYNKKSDQLWTESLTCAALMESFAYVTEADPNAAYTLGLIHSIGKIVISLYMKANHIETRKNQSLTATEAHQILGFDYAKAGASLLKKWDFPESITTPIEYFLDPEKTESYTRHAHLLALAYKLCPDFPSKFKKENVILANQTGLDKTTFAQACRLAEKRMTDIRNLVATL